MEAVEHVRLRHVLLLSTVAVYIMNCEAYAYYIVLKMIDLVNTIHEHILY